jgi:hypothetical protein
VSKRALKREPTRRKCKRTRELTRKRTRDLYANAGRKILHQQEKKSAHVCIMPVFQRGKRAGQLMNAGVTHSGSLSAR